MEGQKDAERDGEPERQTESECECESQSERERERERERETETNELMGFPHFECRVCAKSPYHGRRRFFLDRVFKLGAFNKSGAQVRVLKFSFDKPRCQFAAGTLRTADAGKASA